MTDKEITGCIEYAGYRNADGYGWVTFRNRQMGAHRAEWIKKNGEIEAGMMVLHKCDNPSCINTDHLYIGSQHENMRDRSVRGRTNLTKLSATEVKQIREKRKQGEYLKDIAAKYGVSVSMISFICRNERRVYA